jgi:hypothetical protein
MPVAPVGSNNTPLVALWTLDALHLLCALCGEVLICLAVRDEFLDFAPVLRAHALAGAHWIKPVAIASPQRALSFTASHSPHLADAALRAIRAPNPLPESAPCPAAWRRGKGAASSCRGKRR